MMCCKAGERMSKARESGAQTERLKSKSQRSFEVHYECRLWGKGKDFLQSNKGSFFHQRYTESRRVLSQKGQHARDASTD